MSNASVVQSECLAYLATLAPNSIDSCVTDPPYELNFMGRHWDRSGIANQVELWRAVYRVLKPGAHLVAFGGTRTAHRMVCAIEDAGFEIRDSLQWLYGSGFNKNANCLKPAHEPICLARKPVAKTVKATIAAYGTGGINVEVCRVGTDVIKSSGLASLSLQKACLDNGIRKYAKGLPGANYPSSEHIGRWPPNVLLTHSAACNGHCAPDCPVAALDGQSGTLHSGGKAGARYVWKQDHGSVVQFHQAEGKLSGTCTADAGGASRFYPILNYDPAYDDPFLYCAKASRKERNAGCAGLPERVAGNVNQFMDGTRSNWIEDARHPGGGYAMAPPQANANHHPTVKPVALCRWLVRLVTPIGGTALDPFAGSGSVGVACKLEDRCYVGCDQDAEYVEIANRRIAATQPALLGV